MSKLKRTLSGAALGLALLAAAGPAFAGDDGAPADGGYRDGGANVGGFYRGPDSRGYSGAGSNYGLGRFGHYGKALSPFPCPYPSLYVVPSGASGPR